jgi:hypothetical protein
MFLLFPRYRHAGFLLPGQSRRWAVTQIAPPHYPVSAMNHEGLKEYEKGGLLRPPSIVKSDYYAFNTHRT